jgi:hypothetical protein
MTTTIAISPAGLAQALEVQGRVLVAAHTQITSILGNRLSARHAALLARPVPAVGGGLNWTTELAGTVLPASRLSVTEGVRLKQLADALMADVRGLATTMRAEGTTGLLVAQMIERTLLQPAGDWLFSVGGQPVLTMWGHVALGEVLPPIESAEPTRPPESKLVAPAPQTPDAEVVAVAQSAAVTTQQVPPMAPATAAATAAGPTYATIASGRLVAWAMVALLLALLLFGMKRCTDAADLSAQLIAAAERNQKLEEQLRLKRTPQQQCVPDPLASAALASDPAEAQKRVRERGGEEGKLEVTLAWSGVHDIDLHVTCPQGEKVWAREMSACGGQTGYRCQWIGQWQSARSGRARSVWTTCSRQLSG